MSSAAGSGRQRDVDEIVMYERAAEVGRLLLGDLKGPMQWIYYDQYLGKPRKELQARKHSIRAYLGTEIGKFCRRNFEDVKPGDLARLYEPLYARGSVWRLPLSEFIEELGVPKEGVLRGAPLHATVSISYLWGLQTEYPEMHLVRDLALSLNAVIAAERELEEYERISKSEAKLKQKELAALQGHGAFNKRMCILSCFNLVEAYVNGLAWEYVHTHDISLVSKGDQEALTEKDKNGKDRLVNIVDKLIKIPRIVAHQQYGPLDRMREPLKTFIETVKPYRDSIVHASPFSAPENFGDYDKLSKLYELSLDTVKKAVSNTLAIISQIHQFTGADNDLPEWVYPKNDDGSFDMAS